MGSGLGGPWAIEEVRPRATVIDPTPNIQRLAIRVRRRHQRKENLQATQEGGVPSLECVVHEAQCRRRKSKKLTAPCDIGEHERRKSGMSCGLADAHCGTKTRTVRTNG